MQSNCLNDYATRWPSVIFLKMMCCDIDVLKSSAGFMGTCQGFSHELTGVGVCPCVCVVLILVTGEEDLGRCTNYIVTSWVEGACS